jgi:hypothetical protein
MSNARQKIQEYECDTLSKFLQHVATEVGREPVGGEGPILLWRGQSDAAWALRPRLSAIWETSSGDFQATEQKMFQEFRQAAPFLLPSASTNDWDRLSIAAHYGMKTRLLDWTVNPMVALWFALAKPKDVDAAVWSFRPSGSNMPRRSKLTATSPFTIDKTTIFRPEAHSPRIAMQAGWHSAHRFTKAQGLLAIDRIKEHATNLALFRIPRSKRGGVFDRLEGSGISVTTVFGDLPSLCSFISDRHCTE